MTNQKTYTEIQVHEIVALALEAYKQQKQKLDNVSIPNEELAENVVTEPPSEEELTENVVIEPPSEEELVDSQTTTIIENIQRESPQPNELQAKALDVIENIEDIAMDFLYIQRPELITVMIWVILTRFRKDLPYAPILLIDAKGLGCGKSTLQKLATQLCGLPAKYRFSHFTPAGLRAYVNDYPDRPLFLDEVDMAKPTVVNDIGSFLNAGFERDGAQALTNFGVTPVYNDKCLAGIGIKDKLPEATISRSLYVSMKETPTGEEPSKKHEDIRTSDFISLSKQIDDFCADNYDEVLHYLYNAKKLVVDKLQGRAGDVWSKVLVFATLLGEDYFNEVLKLMKANIGITDEQAQESEYSVSQPAFKSKALPNNEEFAKKEFISALRAIYEYKQESLTTKELFEVMHDTLKISACPDSTRKLASYMRELKFKLSTCVKKTSGFTRKAVNDVIKQHYLSLIDDKLVHLYSGTLKN
ncbi:hypothetical protein JMA18_15550 [Acinetobacter baumannii]|uniref:hypothetical protein n=1 Tax=Acinetobacter baumannii TaxID=470 RepID=UPI0007109FC5|nr:hypothetical protein [Acinetobacter baumannii]EHU3104674.1 hypothetical protein [Acinetobacter baumannii]EHU3329665.1 hypothetical protein [Acinetobacter baumannii]EHU3415561.1 hypothetical protein [Acinetobacter baumannii]EIB6928528.1 hypothetical protein [Acinetobacter baumannii]MBN7891396.1 hypothetical protein [Acinetobacter baumannii]